MFCVTTYCSPFYWLGTSSNIGDQDIVQDSHCTAAYCNWDKNTAVSASVWWYYIWLWLILYFPSCLAGLCIFSVHSFWRKDWSLQKWLQHIWIRSINGLYLLFNHIYSRFKSYLQWRPIANATDLTHSYRQTTTIPSCTNVNSNSWVINQIKRNIKSTGR